MTEKLTLKALSSLTYPPSSCHHLSSFGLLPPSPSGDDVIYVRPLTDKIRKVVFDALKGHTLLDKQAPFPEKTAKSQKVCRP